uniref:ATP-dependent DNA helicase n=3 Tax=Caenorhabditis japonica TaxID=281687 RepID=A0A8R1E559_CAEJA
MGTIFNHAFGSTKLNRPQEELNQGVQIAVCNSLATTPKESAIRKKKDRESRRLRRAASTEKEKMMERISNSQSKLETRLSEMQERAEERRASLRSNAKAKRASETKEQRTERFTYHSTRYRNKKDEKNATTAKNAFGEALHQIYRFPCPGDPEKYALRLMLLYTKGATSFSDLKTTKDDNGIPTVHDTFVEAVKAQGFLSDDAVVIKSTYMSEDFLNRGYGQEESEARAYYKNFVIAASTDFTLPPMFVLDGPGGAGKTYTYNVILHMLTAMNKNVQCTAWTVTASTLLQNGRTSASLFKLNIGNDSKTSNHSKGSDEAKKLKEVDVILWDECSMISKTALETADFVLRELTDSRSAFGGKRNLLGGDFRQILPVIRHGTKTTTVSRTVIPGINSRSSRF